MASNTNNLGLLKKDPVADGNDTFNVRTMLNENWDKIDEFAGKTTPISRGGTGATTAAQALANLGGIAEGAVGNLHVWDKETVSYSVKNVTQSSNITLAPNTSYQYATSVVGGPNGTELVNPTTFTTPSAYGDISVLNNKYVKVNGKVYMWTGASNTSSSGWSYACDEIVTVTTIVHSDYLTSTDRNAYPDQSAEGGQDAYYVLGEEQNTRLITASVDVTFQYADNITVSEDGAVGLAPTVYSETISYDSVTSTEILKGRFIQANTTSNAIQGVYFVPSDATFNLRKVDGANYVYCDKLQPVTGHAAIPANTTITYLGQLGGGARIEVGSYVGTGTYGKSNPNTITFEFEPKLVAIFAPAENGNNAHKLFMLRNVLGASILDSDGNNNGVIVTWSEKSVTWYAYQSKSAQYQMNGSNYTYHYIAIG